ncbi:globin [Texcoconibacillus texcoconensis]|uniref:Hemoglobin n=1 Tax=Texcoconibacillus texcoconensis TaxID=1095777 RepID=A0A840QU82_9BACI|nr:globin [Texcoconibacillus texcoconensis]MBB5174849.1 hemoglobin [Texcoconibacillus texcoconensis]
MTSEQSIYERIGENQLSSIVDRFYHYVSNHPELAPIFPDDLTETARKQKQFLTQFFGGPPLYSQEHGHPMLRARHMPFQITPTRAKRWIECMIRAIDEEPIGEPLRTEMIERLQFTANHMVNSSEPS